MSSWAHHNTLCYTYCCYLKGCRDFRVWEGDYSKKRTCQAWSLQSGASVAIQDNLIRPPSKRWSSGIISKIYLLFGGTTGKLPSCRPANLFRDAKREHVSWIPSCLQPCHEGTIHHSESFRKKLILKLVVSWHVVNAPNKNLRRNAVQRFRTPSSHCPFQSKTDVFAPQTAQIPWRLRILSILDMKNIFRQGRTLVIGKWLIYNIHINKLRPKKGRIWKNWERQTWENADAYGCFQK